ncbi:ROK family transcriptional regulator [Helcobacillus sp. ACRRO]|uniref:ROK family transcriptional regulator n=1 Tax=Helcobacillus sp. ACRRO TaxID=2918202 RepID=UPI001EF45BED|nr:ROK family transcriptional regulator [Helcobacillus sp. ACRRO]MCG7428073.1 ROK family transcriptional regulator [Helcobacillus sp. ACRRO]
MQPTDVRSHNLARVLRRIAFAEDPISRADLAHSTGLTKPTVSKLVDQLSAGGLLIEGEPIRLGGSGRPMIPISAAGDGAVGIGIEISADHVAVLVRRLDGSTAAKEIEAGTFEDAPEAAARAAARLLAPHVETLASQTKIPGISAAIPGRISHDRSVVASAPNLGWEGIPFADMLQRELGQRVKRRSGYPRPRLGNDARLVARTEMLTRRGESFIVVHGETGIGGTVVINGQILHGDQGWAGEIGHVVVDPNGPQCRCGRSGCLESYASAWAIRRKTGLSEDIPINELPSKLAPEALDEMAYWLGIGLSSTITLLDIPTVVLAGYFGRMFPQIQQSVGETINAHSLAAEDRPVTIAEAAISDNGPLLGAAIYSLQPLLDNPLPYLRTDSGPAAA